MAGPAGAAPALGPSYIQQAQVNGGSTRRAPGMAKCCCRLASAGVALFASMGSAVLPQCPDLLQHGGGPFALLRSRHRFPRRASRAGGTTPAPPWLLKTHPPPPCRHSHLAGRLMEITCTSSHSITTQKKVHGACSGKGCCMLLHTQNTQKSTGKQDRRGMAVW